MEPTLALSFAAIVGFTHAFEADHLVAVSNLVTRRDRLKLAMKDGIYWGLGHSSTILLIGLFVIVARAAIPPTVFTWLEAGVGIMLIGLGVWRLSSAWRKRNSPEDLVDDQAGHRLAYGVGLIHGLAGSGALILLVLANAASTLHGVLYLLLFGLGSIGGMLFAAGILGLPFSKKYLQHIGLQLGLIILSSIFCIGYGGYVVLENLS